MIPLVDSYSHFFQATQETDKRRINARNRIPIIR